MKSKKSAQLRKGVLCGALAFATLVNSVQADPVVNWGAGLWSNGGPVQTGYGNGWTSGTSVTDGVEVDVAWTNHGASGVNTGTENLTVSTVLSGGSGIPSLRLQQTGDANGANPFTKYTTLTLTFDSSVTLASAFTLYDVDKSSGGSWTDYIVVNAYLGGVNGTLLTTTYTTTINNQVITAYGNPPGVQGLNDIPSDSSAANVGIQFSGAFDTIVITFAQAPSQNAAASHGIGISNIALTAVPEPGTWALVTAAGMGVIFLRRRRHA